MFLSAKKQIKKVLPISLMKPALSVVRKKRFIQHWADMKLFPSKMNWSCPCCGMKFRSFIQADYLDPSRFNPKRYEHAQQDVLCPVCKSLPRHRILALWCEEHKHFLRKSEILYFAPEYSMTLWMKRNCVSCVTADLYQDADLKIDIQSTGLRDESYDVIICNHVLEHVDDYIVALAEIFRILKKGGIYICSFPMDPAIELIDEDPCVQTEEECFQRFGQYDHKRVFGMHADRLLSEIGFYVETISGDSCSEEILPVVGPADYDMNILFLCMKGMQ